MTDVISMICKDCGAWWPRWKDAKYDRDDCLDCGGELIED